MDAGACQMHNRMKNSFYSQINANFFNCAHMTCLVTNFNSTEYVREGEKADCLFQQHSAATFIKPCLIRFQMLICKSIPEGAGQFAFESSPVMWGSCRTTTTLQRPAASDN